MISILKKETEKFRLVIKSSISNETYIYLYDKLIAKINQDGGKLFYQQQQQSIPQSLVSTDNEGSNKNKANLGVGSSGGGTGGSTGTNQNTGGQNNYNSGSGGCGAFLTCY